MKSWTLGLRTGSSVGEEEGQGTEEGRDETVGAHPRWHKQPTRRDDTGTERRVQFTSCCGLNCTPNPHVGVPAPRNSASDRAWRCGLY